MSQEQTHARSLTDVLHDDATWSLEAAGDAVGGIGGSGGSGDGGRGLEGSGDREKGRKAGERMENDDDVDCMGNSEDYEGGENDESSLSQCLVVALMTSEAFCREHFYSSLVAVCRIKVALVFVFVVVAVLLLFARW